MLGLAVPGFVHSACMHTWGQKNDCTWREWLDTHFYILILSFVQRRQGSSLLFKIPCTWRDGTFLPPLTRSSLIVEEISSKA